jgi:hypothetical protein
VHKINHGVKAAHASIPFQCKDCWFLNLKGQHPEPGADDIYVKCIRQANLDSMSGRVTTTIKAHAAAIKRTVLNCACIRKTPTIPMQGPMPLSDQLGIGMAVDMFFNSFTAQSRLEGEAFIQLDSMRKPRSTFTSALESLSAGIQEGTTFATGAMKVTVTSCLTQQRWFGFFMRGAESQMGYVSQQNQPLGPGVVAKMLEVVEWEMEDHKGRIHGDFVKISTAVALASCASLRGPKVFLLDLAGLWEYINIEQRGVMPCDPMKTGTDLTNAPHVVATLIGKFKGKLGT